MKVVVTGANGFIGKNVVHRLREIENYKVYEVIRTTSTQELRSLLRDCDILIHLAGENRPHDENEFFRQNKIFTEKLCELLNETGNQALVIFSSSSQVASGSLYGDSKLGAEQALKSLHETNGNPVRIYRLPGVFGKWCKPNYNSVVATFCHNLANNLPIKIDSHDKKIALVYIDDVLDEFLSVIDAKDGYCFCSVETEYSITLGELANLIEEMRNSHRSINTLSVGSGFKRALYATYLSYLPEEDFYYPLVSHEDPRGRFTELFRTESAGQISVFTAGVGVTRGGHYHNTKSEKFIILQGVAEFYMQNIVTGEKVNIVVSDTEPHVVQTVPGWAHSIKNLGQTDLVALVWANENFDPNQPDTYVFKVKK